MASQNEIDDDDLALWNAGPPRVAPPAPPADSTSSDESSEAESEDSATARARAAEARLRDHNEPPPPAAPAIVLPSAADAFGAVVGPPAFLNPEATRQLPEVHRAAAGGAAAAEEEAPAPRQRQHGDISRLAPKLPKSDKERESDGVIESGAKRQKAEGGLAVDVATAAAMLGGGEVKRDRGKATAAQGVEDFLASGGAPLPRKRQERKDREKEKRGRGQSAHSEWKSEAEMALRQQYD